MNTFDKLRMMIMNEKSLADEMRDYKKKNTPKEEKIIQWVNKPNHDTEDLYSFYKWASKMGLEFNGTKILPNEQTAIKYIIDDIKDAVIDNDRKQCNKRANDFEREAKKIIKKYNLKVATKNLEVKKESTEESVKSLKLKIYESWDAGLIKDYEKDYLLEYINESCMNDE